MIKRSIYIIALCVHVIVVNAQDAMLSKQITLSVTNKTLKDVIKEISAIGDVEFSYNPEIIPQNKYVNYRVENQRIDSVLKDIFGGLNISSKEVEGLIILFKENINTTAVSKWIGGTVLYEKTMEPIPYSTVRLKDNSAGTVCDELGKFNLEIQKKKFEDTLVISAMGYKDFVCDLDLFFTTNEIVIIMEDSVFQIDEVTALSYDFIEPCFWTSNSKHQDYLLTCATRNKNNAENFVNFLEEEHGYSRTKKTVIAGKKVEIKGVSKKDISIDLKYFKCNYCPIEENYSITIKISDRWNHNLLYNDKDRLLLTAYFQNLLNKSFIQGVDFSQLTEFDGIVYCNGKNDPYSGGCYSFYKKGNKWKTGYYEFGKKRVIGKWWFSNGQIGKNATYKNGKLDGRAEYWFDNSQQKFVLNYNNGEKQGAINYWYENGKKRIEASYSHDKLNGSYKMWHQNGKLAKEAWFKNGVVITATEWDKKGRVIKKLGGE